MRRPADRTRASQAGVREADPEAKFLLHIAHWWDADFCIAFFLRFIARIGFLPFAIYRLLLAGFIVLVFA